MASIVLKTPHEIALLAEANQFVARVLQLLEDSAEVGVSTWDLDQIAYAFCKREGVEPAFLGLYGFPASLCISLNSEVVHGIPSKARKLKKGDLVSCDFGVKHRDFYGDSARSFLVGGEGSAEARRLLKVTEESLELAIAECQPGRRLGDLGHAVQRHVEAAGFSVVRDFVGHGIGRKLHEEPQVKNFGLPGRGRRLEAGMVIAVEPMVNAGTWQVNVLEDEWTVVTGDGRLSAHFEHSVAITVDGPQVLSRLATPGQG